MRDGEGFRAEIRLVLGYATASSQMSSLERKRARLEREVSNLAKAIGSGLDSPAVRSELVTKEREIKSIDAQVISAKPESIKVQIRDARKFVESSLSRYTAVPESRYCRQSHARETYASNSHEARGAAGRSQVLPGHF